MLPKFYSQFDADHVEGAGPAACYRACRAMAASAGVTVPEGTQDRIQVATAEDGLGGVAVADGGQLVRALEYIHTQLEAGRPVVMGVTYKPGGPNRDGMTDHWVLVVSWNANTGHYRVFDPGLAPPPHGQGWNALWVRPISGLLQRAHPVRPVQTMTSVVPSVTSVTG